MADLEAYRDLLEAIDRVDSLQTDIVAAARGTGSARKFEIVQLRRQLAEQLGTLDSLGTSAFSGESHILLSEFRSRLSKLRTAVALHQASWPAVSLDEAPAEYEKSAQGVNAARKALVSWARTTLSPVRTPGTSS